MGRKGKTQKHTAKETAQKHKLAKEANGGAGGGSNGAENRKIACQKSSVNCIVCRTLLPSMKSLEIHYDSKHPKVNFCLEKEKYEELFNKNTS